MSRHAHRPARSPGRHAAGRARRGRHAQPGRAPRTLVALAVVPAVLASGSAAYAYWSATAAGTATVHSATSVALTLAAGATAPANLHPGRVVDVPLTVNNPNPYPVALTHLTSLQVVSSDPACPAATNVVATSAVTAALGSGGLLLATPVTVPAGGAGALTLPQLITMVSTAPDACQGDTFTVDLALTGSQV